MTTLLSSRPSEAYLSKLLSPVSAHPVLDAGIQAFIDRRAEQGEASFHELPFEEARKSFARAQEGKKEGTPAVAQDLIVPVGPKGSVHVRIIRPAQALGPLPIVMYFHGGGWVMGDCHTHDRLICELAIATNSAVVFVDYTRAPEGQYPLQNEEAYASMLHVVKNAESLRLNPRAVALVGDCAGGSMVASIAILARKRRGPPIALQIMFNPTLSARLLTESSATFASGPWMSRAAMQKFFDAQFPRDSESNLLDLPINASFTELEGLPAALIITAENDLVRDEGEQYARKLMQAGVEVTAVRYLGTIHDFVVLDELAYTPPSRAAMSQACATLRAELHKAR